MPTINNISFLNYGLHLSQHNGILDLPNVKDEFFIIYGKAGYQITKRQNNVLKLHCYLIASNLAEFKTKIQDLYTLFSSPGIKVINIENENLNTFARNGFKVSGVHIQTKVFAKFYIELDIV